MAGVLYVVATPIGNLEDITLRALRVLNEVDLIAAEDTRHTQTLLSHYDIRTPLTSYHEHNERSKAAPLIGRLSRGENIALVSDAGTPAISDPGYRLVAAAIGAAITVVPLPGASAVLAVLSASGLPSDRFTFEGFLPAAKPNRRKRLQALQGESRTMVFYEAPHRLKESLEDVREILGDRDISIGREVSKLHEEFLRGTASAVLHELAKRDIKGELTLIVHGNTAEFAIPEDQIKADIVRLVSDGSGVKEISELIGERYGLAKREVYRRVLEIKTSKP